MINLNRRSPGLGLGARRFRAERLLPRTRWSPAESLCHLGIRSLPLCESGCDTCVAVQPLQSAPVGSIHLLAGTGAGANGHRTPERKIRGETLHGGFLPRVVFDATLCVSNGPPVLVRGLSRCRVLSPVLRGHVAVVRALAPALRTDRLNSVHVLYSRCDVPVRERDRRALCVRHILQQPVLI